MPKACNNPSCNRTVFSTGFCKIHQYMRTDEKWLRSIAKAFFVNIPDKVKPAKDKKVYRIPKMSKKLQRDNATYLRMLPDWKRLFSICCFPGCDAPTAHCHHSKGRGKYLLVVSTWRPVCEGHHVEIELNPNMAKKLNLSVSRLTTLEKDVELFESGFYE